MARLDDRQTVAYVALFGDLPPAVSMTDSVLGLALGEAAPRLRCNGGMIASHDRGGMGLVR